MTCEAAVLALQVLLEPALWLYASEQALMIYAVWGDHLPGTVHFRCFDLAAGCSHDQCQGDCGKISLCFHRWVDLKYTTPHFPGMRLRIYAANLEKIRNCYEAISLSLKLGDYCLQRLYGHISLPFMIMQEDDETILCV